MRPAAMPVGAVMRNEWRYLGSQRIARILGGLLAVCLLIALFAGWFHHQQQLQQQAAFQSLVDRQWAEQPDRHPHRVAHFGTFAFRLPAALAFFEPGVDRNVGNSLFLEAHRQNPANFTPAGQMSSMGRFPGLSPAFLLQTLLPLIIVALAGLSVTREREQHTAAQLRAQGLTPAALLTGKAMAYWLAGCAAVVIVCVGLIPLVTLTRASPETAIAALLLALIYALHTGIWTLLAVQVSARSADSRQALALLAGIWLVLAMVMPRVLPYWSSLGVTESRIAFTAALEADLRRYGDSHDTGDARFNAFREKVLEQYGVKRVEDLPVNFGGLVMQEGERRTSEVFSDHYSALQSRWDDQERRLAWWSLLSPVLALQQASAALAGTDRAAFRHFEVQAEAYRYAFIQQLNQVHTHEIGYQDDRAQRVSAEHWRAIAPFEYAPEPLAERLPRAGLPLATLLAWALLLTGATRRVRELRA